MPAEVSITLEELILLKAEARGFRLSPHQPLQSILSGRYASRLRGRGLDFAELRGYRPGDDIRCIDWKATARRGRTQIRVYEEEKERPVYVAVDQRQGMYFGSRRAMKSVVAAKAAALSAWRVLANGDRLGGWVFGENGHHFTRARRGQASVLQFLHVLSEENQDLTLNASGGNAEGLNLLLGDVEQKLTHDGLLVLISDLAGADDETGERLTRLSRHNDVLVAPVYDPLGIQLQGMPGMWVSGGGQRRQVPPDARFTGRLSEAFGKEVAYWQELFRELHIPMLPLSTARPVLDQVREALGGMHA